MRFTLRSKLLIIASTIALAFLLLIAAAAALSRRSTVELQRIQERFLPKIELGPRLDQQLDALTRSFQDAVAARDSDALEHTARLKVALLDLLATGKGAVDPADADAVRSALEDYYRTAFDVSRRLIAGETGEPIVDSIASMQAKQRRVAALVKTATAFDRDELTRAFVATSRAMSTSQRAGVAVAVMCMVVVLTLTAWVGRSTLTTVAQLTHGLERFGTGRFDEHITPTSSDELSDVARHANQMADNLKALAAERDRQDWLRSGQAGLVQELRGELTPAEAAGRACTYLSRYVHAPAAALYYRDVAGDLALLGGVGAVAANHVHPGEGFVGQAALHNEVQVLSEVPQGYFTRPAGLDEAHPATLAFVPLIHGGEVRGVLELALLGSWSGTLRDLLLSVRESLAIAVEVSLTRVRTQALLAETQALAHRLEAQEDELRTTNWQLQLQREELKESNAALVNQTSQLEQQRSTLEERNRELEATRRRLEHQTHALATVSSYKSQFLTRMSHELRTPLNSMLLLSGLLAENQDHNLNPKQIEFSETIHAAGRELLALIDQVLDLAKVEAGKPDVRIGPVALRDVARRAQRVFEPLAREKGLALTVETAAGAPATISSDHRRVDQIVTNLLGNAIKFTEHGTVSLQIAARPAGGVSLIVSDTGPGIAPDDQERIFAPFEQVDGRSDRRYGGTGLGLAISRELASLLGGSLELQRSAPNQGSVFACHLPAEVRGPNAALAPKALAAAGESGQPPAAGGAAVPLARPAHPSREARGARELEHKRVLVADDDPRTVHALTAILESRGAHVVAASTGKAALELLVAHPDIAAVLMDIMMPELDGYEAIRRLRQDERFRALPVIALTANAMKGDRERCFAAGATAYLAKPLGPEKLLPLLLALL
jgi:signal transduction histidine kinase